MASEGDGDRGASGDASTRSTTTTPSTSRAPSEGRRELPPPPEVRPGDRTVVTRAPRPSEPADPSELLPTVRVPPSEARAVRREAEGLAARLLGSRPQAPAPTKPTPRAPVKPTPSATEDASAKVDASA